MPHFLVPDPSRIRQYSDNMDFTGSLLEVGTGSGILAKIALERGADPVVAIDINPYAVANAKQLAAGAQVFESDLFSAVDGRFDNIVFAAPWSEGEIRTPLDYAIYDNGVVARFLSEAASFLNDDGKIWLQYCDAFPNNFNRLRRWIAEGGLDIEQEWRYQTYGQLVKREVNVILYKLVRKADS